MDPCTVEAAPQEAAPHEAAPRVKSPLATGDGASVAWCMARPPGGFHGIELLQYRVEHEKSTLKALGRFAPSAVTRTFRRTTVHCRLVSACPLSIPTSYLPAFLTFTLVR